MFSSALVVFREVFEIVLIVGIILAATRDMKDRTLAIGLGFGGGLAGSALVALFMERISALAEGVGQEIFNAMVLFTAALFIGWTVLWMKRHAREMKSHFSNVGKAVNEGRLPYFSLSLVIMLALLREGSEIVLFTYGMLAAGQSAASLLSGFALGIVGGGLLGVLIYKGLLKISMRYFFTVTSWLLVLLVAGMISQGLGFLVAAGKFGGLSHTVWDSSWLLDDQGIVGLSLRALLGYTARPTEVQLIAYALTLLSFVVLMNFPGAAKLRRAVSGPQGSVAAIILFGLVSLTPGHAHAGKKVYTPYVVQGELEVEMKSEVAIDDDSDVSGEQEHEFAIGYGVNDFWKTELEIEFEKSGEHGSDFESEALEWENIIQLTQPGEYWLDAGLYGAYEQNLQSGPNEFKAKLLLAKDIGKTSHALNISFTKEVGYDAEGLEGGFAWSSRYRFKPWLEPGVEWYSEFGELKDTGAFDEQQHSAGPVVYGVLGKNFKYDIGYLVGLSDESPDGDIKANLEYEWHF